MELFAKIVNGFQPSEILFSEVFLKLICLIKSIIFLVAWTKRKDFSFNLINHYSLVLSHETYLCKFNGRYHLGMMIHNRQVEGSGLGHFAVWKVCECGVFSGLYSRKCGSGKIPYYDTFHADFYYSHRRCFLHKTC